ncbi:MAG: methylated-DNA--[protein]-cysteine S-methyltransferase [bacterium]
MPRRAENIPTPLGPLLAEFAEDGSLLRLEFAEAPQATNSAPKEPASPLARQLREYFSGRRRDFDLPLASAGTPFQQKVWAELRRIPFGETLSYAELARRLGDPGAVRAVARANALNPIAILIPCHRVIGSDGSLTGYAAGLERKARLLVLEGHQRFAMPAQLAFFS